jgi:predicted amidophosphoribosyltransferase
MTYIATVLQKARDALSRFYVWATRPACPDCGSRRHQHHKWQCAACGEAIGDVRVGRCPHCYSRHLDSIRKCEDCGRVWNPRFQRTRQRLEGGGA